MSEISGVSNASGASWEPETEDVESTSNTEDSSRSAPADIDFMQPQDSDGDTFTDDSSATASTTDPPESPSPQITQYPQVSQLNDTATETPEDLKPKPVKPSETGEIPDPKPKTPQSKAVVSDDFVAATPKPAGSNRNLFDMLNKRGVVKGNPNRETDMYDVLAQEKRNKGEWPRFSADRFGELNQFQDRLEAVRRGDPNGDPQTLVKDIDTQKQQYEQALKDMVQRAPQVRATYRAESEKLRDNPTEAVSKEFSKAQADFFNVIQEGIPEYQNLISTFDNLRNSVVPRDNGIPLPNEFTRTVDQARLEIGPAVSSSKELQDLDSALRYIQENPQQFQNPAKLNDEAKQVLDRLQVKFDPSKISYPLRVVALRQDLKEIREAMDPQKNGDTNQNAFLSGFESAYQAYEKARQGYAKQVEEQRQRVYLGLQIGRNPNISNEFKKRWGIPVLR